MVPLKAKSLSLHWEFMFTRSMFETDDMIAQHQLLTRVAALIDNHPIKTTLANTTALSPPPICRKRTPGWKPDAPSARSCWRGFKMNYRLSPCSRRTRPNGTPRARPLQALLLPTRQEPGNLDYALFQLRDAPDTFYTARGVVGTGRPRCPCRDALFCRASMAQMEFSAGLSRRGWISPDAG